MQASVALARMWKKRMEYVPVTANVPAMAIVLITRNVVIIVYVSSPQAEETVVTMTGKIRLNRILVDNCFIEGENSPLYFIGYLYKLNRL